MVRFTICTYNLLASKYFGLMQREKLDGKPVYDKSITEQLRKTTILRNFANMIDRHENIIFCLQEITQEWHAELISFFTELDYSVEYVLYEVGARDGYKLGVMIAYPNCFITSPDFIKTVVLGDQIPKKNPDATSASEKRNELLMIQFRTIEDSGQELEFVVMTYHMPCDPNNQEIAKWHAKTAMLSVNTEYKCKNIIFAGDFNTTPDKLAYSFLTDTVHMSSVWSQFGRFPNTTHAFIKGEEFAGCIDHVFFKGDLNCIATTVQDPKGIIPSKEQPSDHIPVVVTFDLV